MAIKGARGRKVVVQFSKTMEVTDSEYVRQRRTTIAVMSDHTILEKQDAVFKATGLFGEDKHSYGWKVKSKVKKEVDIHGFAQRYLASALKVGYTQDRV